MPRFAWNRDTRPASQPVAPSNDGRPPYYVPGGMKGQPYTDGWDVQRAVDGGLNASIWVYRCVTWRAWNAAKLPMVVRENDWFSGPAVDLDNHRSILALLNYKANPYEWASDFRRRLSMIVDLSRKGAFVEVVRNKRGEPIALYLLPPQWTFPIPDDQTFVSGYRVWIPAQGYVDLPARDVLWIRNVHPLDPYSGLTPLEAAGLTIETDWFARLFNRNFLASDGRPGMIVSVKGGVSDDDADEIRRRLSGGGRGPEGAGGMAVIEADDITVNELGTNARDMQYAELRSVTKDEILMAFGLPESVLGNASGRTFANADAETEMVWRETMLGHLNTLSIGFDDLVDPLPSHVLSFDFAQVPVLERDRRERSEFGLREYSAGVISTDEYRVLSGRPPVGASKLYTNPVMVPVADVDRPYQPVEQTQGGDPFAQDPMAGLFGALDQTAADMPDPMANPALAPTPPPAEPAGGSPVEDSVEDLPDDDPTPGKAWVPVRPHGPRLARRHDRPTVARW